MIKMKSKEEIMNVIAHEMGYTFLKKKKLHDNC